VRLTGQGEPFSWNLALRTASGDRERPTASKFTGQPLPYGFSVQIHGAMTAQRISCPNSLGSGSPTDFSRKFIGQPLPREFFPPKLRPEAPNSLGSDCPAKFSGRSPDS
jgi:hypothetical protein